MPMLQSSTSSVSEWRSYWHVPLVSALGFSAASLQTFIVGPFTDPLHAAFGWSRGEISSGFAVANMSSTLLAALVGMIVDRWGPRRAALAGILLKCVTIALLATATGTVGNWRLLWLCVAVGSLGVSATIWTSAVVQRFTAGRGLAIGMTMCGSMLTGIIVPPLLTALIHFFNWRVALVALGALWASVLFPLIYIFFREGDGQGRPVAAQGKSSKHQAGVSIRTALQSPIFYQLVFVGGCFSFSMLGIVVHLIPILTDIGATPMVAAGIASLAGVFAMLGRLGTGLSLDRYPAHIVGAVVCALPIAGCLLLIGKCDNAVALFTIAAVIGLSWGGELDIISYLVARHFGPRNFGVLFGAILTTVGMGSALGPLAMGMTFDSYRSYAPLLAVTAALMAICAATLMLLQRPRGVVVTP